VLLNRAGCVGRLRKWWTTVGGCGRECKCEGGCAEGTEKISVSVEIRSVKANVVGDRIDNLCW
jgi:hypothetical protein